jgi:hypothetical protein
MTIIRRAAAAAMAWRKSAACQGINDEEVFSDRPKVQAQIQGVCRGCFVRTTCLIDAIEYEDSQYMVWGVSGGLTDMQRRALQVEAVLGNRPNLEQAEKLSQPVFAEFMQTWRDWPADVVAAEVRKHGILAAPVTVRLALWWVGGRGSLLGPRGEGDARATWMVVRDEHRETVTRLRKLGASNINTAAYLGVARDALEKAVRSWRAQDEQEVEAA